MAVAGLLVGTITFAFGENGRRSLSTRRSGVANSCISSGFIGAMVAEYCTKKYEEEGESLLSSAGVLGVLLLGRTAMVSVDGRLCFYETK